MEHARNTVSELRFQVNKPSTPARVSAASHFIHPCLRRVAFLSSQSVGTDRSRRRYCMNMEKSMTRYLDTPAAAEPPKPDINTHIRTNPRVKGILWTAGIGMGLLIVIAAVISHVL